MWDFLLFQARRNKGDVWISQWYLMTLPSFFSSECFQVSPVDWHRSGHCHWTPLLPYWLLQLPLVLQEGSAGNETRASPANVDGDGLSVGAGHTCISGETHRALGLCWDTCSQSQTRLCLLSDFSLDLKLLLVTRHVLRTIRPYLATWEFSFSSSTFCIGIVSF